MNAITIGSSIFKFTKDSPLQSRALTAAAGTPDGRRGRTANS